MTYHRISHRITYPIRDFKDIERRGAHVRHSQRGSAMATAAQRQKQLDESQYTRKGVLKYEKMFGNGSIGVGGIAMTASLLDTLRPSRGSHVLDVGCGIGGNALYMATCYGMKVTGADLSHNVLEIARER